MLSRVCFTGFRDVVESSERKSTKDHKSKWVRTRGLIRRFWLDESKGTSADTKGATLQRTRHAQEWAGKQFPTPRLWP